MKILFSLFFRKKEIDRLLTCFSTGKYLLGYFHSFILPLSSIKFSKYIEHTDSGFVFELSFMLLLTFVTAVYLFIYSQAEQSLSSLTFISKCDFTCFYSSFLKDISLPSFLPSSLPSFFPSFLRSSLPPSLPLSLPPSLPCLLPLGSNLEIEQVKKGQDK